MLLSGRRPHFFAHTEKFKTLCLCFFSRFLTVFPLALFLHKQRTLDIHEEQNATLARKFVNFYWQSFELLLLEPTLGCQSGNVFVWRFNEAFTSVHSCHHSNLILRGTWPNKDVIWTTSLYKPFRFIKISQYYLVGNTSFNQVSSMNLNFNKTYLP